MAEDALGFKLTTDISKKAAKWLEKISQFPEEIDKAVGNNAALALRESIVEIDALIYSTPESPGYHRTKNLRRSNKIKKVGDAAWLIYNDAKYAPPVHNGTVAVRARPWMKNAIDRKQSEMTNNLVKAGTAVLQGDGLDDLL